MNEDFVLECDVCGVVLYHLTPAQQQAVADNPYNFSLFCTPCKRMELEHAREFD